MRDDSPKMQPVPYLEVMSVLEALASAFINTFGITQPSEATRRRAAWFILGMILLTLLLVSVIGYAFFAAMHR